MPGSLPVPGKRPRPVRFGFRCKSLSNPEPIDGELILATTTSTQDSGLLEVLLPRLQAVINRDDIGGP